MSAHAPVATPEDWTHALIAFCSPALAKVEKPYSTGPAIWLTFAPPLPVIPSEPRFMSPRYARKCPLIWSVGPQRRDATAYAS